MLQQILHIVMIDEMVSRRGVLVDVDGDNNVMIKRFRPLKAPD